MESNNNNSIGFQKVNQFFELEKGWKPFEFQTDVWKAYNSGKSGLLNAPTGSGKTYALWFSIVIEWINNHPNDYLTAKNNGLQFLWITPLRSLAKDIYLAIEESIQQLKLPWQIAIRTGDVSASDKSKIKKNNPEVLITTPESLMLMLSQRDYPISFQSLKCLVCDEWHELMGGKRGVMLELAISRIKGIKPDFKVWGISATIGNIQEAMDVLLGKYFKEEEKILIKSTIQKKIEIVSIFPEEIEKYPWSGHLGLRMINKVMPIIFEAESTLLFTNTRSQSEIWFKAILELHPELAGTIALHHGSIAKDERIWVEEHLKSGGLKIVVCTSSLDLGVDFSPVDAIIQVGSPKGVSRFLQRAGRSGHKPGATSKIYFVPTNSMELLEAAAVKEAVKQAYYEPRIPLTNCFDVLIQYLVTLACGEGFFPQVILEEIKQTNCYKDLEREDWEWILRFIIDGGQSLQTYNEYKKVDYFKDGSIHIVTKRMAMMHRMNIGSIISEPAITIQYANGKYIGTVEETFISMLKIGDSFWFAGKSLELLAFKGLKANVKDTKKVKGLIPSWMGGRMPLSTQLSNMLKLKLSDYISSKPIEEEVERLRPIFELQSELSIIPQINEFLIESIVSEEGYHYFFFPFEGRSVHEGLSSLLAYRLGQLAPLSFSIAMNDYGFELLSDEKIDLDYALKQDIFSLNHLREDIGQAINANEMTRRKFREVAQISGLLAKGFQGKEKSAIHLQSSSSLLFEVFQQFDPNNLLIKQSYNEVLSLQLDEQRLKDCLLRIDSQEIRITYPIRPTPFSFQIMVDRLNRDKLSTESMEDRVKKYHAQYLDSL